MLEKSDFETKMEQARVELDAWNASVAELGAHAMEVEKQLDHCAFKCVWLKPNIYICMMRLRY